MPFVKNCAVNYRMGTDPIRDRGVIVSGPHATSTEERAQYVEAFGAPAPRQFYVVKPSGRGKRLNVYARCIRRSVIELV